MVVSNVRSRGNSSFGRPSVSDVGPKVIVPQAIVFPINTIQLFLQTSNENIKWAESVFVLWTAFDANGQCAIVQEESDSAPHFGAIKDLDSVMAIMSQI